MLKLLFLCLAVASASASDVLDLTDSDFQDTVAEHDVILVEFFAPWCGHCKSLAPQYEEAATKLKENDPPIALAKVDCTAQTKTCEKYGVSGYPTLKVFKNGEFGNEYEGGRNAAGIVSYMKSKAGPSTKLIEDVAAAEKWLNGKAISIMGFFASESSEIAKTFMKLSASLTEDFRFAHTFSSEVNEKYGYSDDIVIFRPKAMANKFEPNTVKFDGDDTPLHKLTKWTTDNVYGIAGQRTAGNMAHFKSPVVVAYYNVDYVKDPKGTNYVRNRVMKVGKKLQEAGRDVTFAISAKKDFGQEMTEYGKEDDSDKVVIAGRDAAEKKFVMAEDFSMDNLEKFVTDMLDGNLKPYMKSEAVPADNSGPVKVLVAENFDEIVNDETKDVLVEFYAPWCGHCKTLEPKFNELGEKLSGEANIVIAKMDATANDVPAQYAVSGFPTLYYAPAGSKQNPKKYEGGREVDDFIKYLAKESTEPLSGYDRNGKKTKKTEL